MEKPECFQFLTDELEDRLEQYMKDALSPYSGGPSPSRPVHRVARR
jgi:hypothetical protein